MRKQMRTRNEGRRSPATGITDTLRELARRASHFNANAKKTAFAVVVHNGGLSKPPPTATTAGEAAHLALPRRLGTAEKLPASHSYAKLQAS